MMGIVGIELDNYVGTDMMPDPSPIYFFEKGGMINFTRWAASVLGPDNVRVNCLSPGGYEAGTAGGIYRQILRPHPNLGAWRTTQI